MGTMASQITSLTIVYSTVYSDADQRKYQSSTSLAFVRGIHRRPVNSPHKWPVTRKMFPFDDVIMFRALEARFTSLSNLQNLISNTLTSYEHHDVINQLKSLSIHLFVQQLTQVSNKVQSKALHHQTFVRGIHWWQVDPFHDGPIAKKALPCHVSIMQYNCITCIFSYQW